jgi:hypothetical protein
MYAWRFLCVDRLVIVGWWLRSLGRESIKAGIEPHQPGFQRRQLATKIVDAMEDAVCLPGDESQCGLIARTCGARLLFADGRVWRFGLHAGSCAFGVRYRVEQFAAARPTTNLHFAGVLANQSPR